MEIKKMYIDGEWTEGTSGKLIDSINPATGEVIAQVYESSLEDQPCHCRGQEIILRYKRMA